MTALTDIPHRVTNIDIPQYRKFGNVTRCWINNFSSSNTLQSKVKLNLTWVKCKLINKIM